MPFIHPPLPPLRTLVLASGSPRRQAMLIDLGVPFVQRVGEVDESVLPGESAIDLVLRLAAAKAAVVELSSHEIALAADTIVTIDGEILGKPGDPHEAREMLASLAGREHKVHTGVAVRTSDEAPNVQVATTKVSISSLDEDTVARYVETGEPLDKAGAYAIQGLGAAFVDKIDGSYSNVVGLPLTLARSMLAEVGFDIPVLPPVLR